MTKQDSIDQALPTAGHSPMYVMHKFFGRKQETVIKKYIETYAKEGDIVLDPFCGSGVTIGEALKLNRKVIGIDINPVSIFITRNTIRYIKTQNIINEFNKIKLELKGPINNLYITSCRKCGERIPATCFTWKNEKLVDTRYECSSDGKIINPANNDDLELQRKIDQGQYPHYFDSEAKCKYWYPTDPLYYQDGTPFLKKERFNTIDEIFSKRNLIALARLYDRILQIQDSKLRETFAYAFSSMTHLASKMTPVRPSRPFSSAWVQQSYWYCQHNMESNVWILFERAINGRQGLIKAKNNLTSIFKTICEAKDFEELVIKDQHNYLLLEDSIVDLKKIPNNSVDYVITDPPYGHSIQYGELLFMWGCWLNLMKNFEEITQKEIIDNPRQKKTAKKYEQLLFHAFQNIYRVLKPNHYCTITFHNPNLKYRNILYRTVLSAGFEFEQVIYQPPSRASAKSLLQPFGSQRGDYFFRFKKPNQHKRTEYKTINAQTVENLIVTLVEQILKKYRRPIHYSEIQNLLDPLLYSELNRKGWLMDYNPTSVEKILQKHLGTIFQLVEIDVQLFNNRSVKEMGWGLL